MLLHKLAERRIALLQQPLPPAFSARKALTLAHVALASGIEGGHDRCAIDPAHELADVLPLTHTGRATRDAARGTHGFEQLLGQRECCELGICEADESFAELLR